jgi:hypothetical protein
LPLRSVASSECPRHANSKSGYNAEEKLGIHCQVASAAAAATFAKHRLDERVHFERVCWPLRRNQ